MLDESSQVSAAPASPPDTAMTFQDVLPSELLRTRGPCTTIAGIKFPDYSDDSFHEVPLLEYKIDGDAKGLIIHWVQEHDVSPWTPAELIKHEYELETQQSVRCVPWISYTGGAVDRRCEQAVVDAFRSTSESCGRPSSHGRRHGFYPDCAGWAEIMHNNGLISTAEEVADRRVLAVEAEGRWLKDSARIRLHRLRVVFEVLDSPIPEDEECPVSEDDDCPVLEGDGDEASRA